MLFLKNIFKFIHSYDPTNEYFINALKATVPTFIAIFCLLYFRWQFNLFIFFMPTMLLLISNLSIDYRNKFINMTVLTLEVMLGQFIVCIFSKHEFILLIVLFFLLLTIYSSGKYRIAGGVAGMMIAVSPSLPGGWYNGVQNSISILIAFLISLISLILFECLTGKFRIRSSIIYVSELINDSFVAFTVQNRNNIHKTIHNKYLFNRAYLNRADMVIENIFKTKIDKFYHKITLAILKADIVIEQEQYLFPKNILFSKKTVAVYYFYRRLFRGTSFLSGYFELHKKINEYVPLTEDLILNINLRLQHLTEILKHKKLPNSDVRDNLLIEKWKKNVTEFKNNDFCNIDERILEFYYGLNYILEDMDKLRTQLNTKFRKLLL